jgi:molecular chaperone GrpE
MQDEATEGHGEAVQPAAQAESKPSYVQELEEKLAAKDKELRDLVATYKRDVTQTVEDTKQRLERDAARQQELERGRLIESLLPVLDNMSLAIGSAKQHGADQSLLDGLHMVERQFLDKLAAMGLERFASVGQKFDPKLHEAVAMVPASPDKDGLVVTELRPGFKLGERVLRAAMVQVGRA